MAGVSRREFLHSTGFEIDQLVGPQLARHVERGLLSDRVDQVRLTREGLFVSDAIWPEYLRC